MKEDISSSRYDLLSDIAELYYNEGFSQQEIAEKVNLSRPSISRLLTEARDMGIVTIQIDHPIPTIPTLQKDLENLFPIKSAHVLKRQSTQLSESSFEFGRLGARVILNELENDMVLGVSWGTTVHSIVSAMRPTSLPDVKVVQILGGVGAPYRSIDGPEQVRRIGELLGAQHYYLNAPLLVETPEVAKALMDDHSIKEVLNLAQKSDIALIGIGSIIPEISTFFHSGYLTYENLRKLEKQGIVGALCSSHFDIQGNHRPVAWIDDCSVSISWEEIQDIPIVIGVATGIGKAPAILGAIRSQAIDILITDNLAAEEIIKLS